jgi:hypothetical protein
MRISVLKPVKHSETVKVSLTGVNDTGLANFTGIVIDTGKALKLSNNCENIRKKSFPGMSAVTRRSSLMKNQR